MQGELKQVADLALFAKIVQTGGISRCASDLGMERTTVSRRLGALEKSLGVKLLERSPKHISVTDAGRRCLEQCERLLESAQNATSLATIGAIVTDAAPLAVGAPPDLIERYLDRWLADFEADNKGITVERIPVTMWTEAAIENVDLGVTLAPGPANAGWSNTIGQLPQSVFASPDYAARHAPVQSPADLEKHDCIAEQSDAARQAWRFERDGKPTSVTVHARHRVASLLEAREAARAGLGICRLPVYLCESLLRDGSLVDLLPDVTSAGRDVIVISPRQRQRKTGTAALRMHIERAFNGAIA